MGIRVGEWREGERGYAGAMNESQPSAAPHAMPGAASAGALRATGAPVAASRAHRRQTIPAARGGGRVDSEVGRLREVIVHRPGAEVARLTPINANSLLFDDALDIELAQSEHDALTAILREHGVIVHDFRDLLAESLAVPEARALVLEQAVGPEEVGLSTSEVLTAYLSGLPDVELADILLREARYLERRDHAVFLDRLLAGTIFTAVRGVSAVKDDFEFGVPAHGFYALEYYLLAIITAL